MKIIFKILILIVFVIFSACSKSSLDSERKLTQQIKPVTSVSFVNNKYHIDTNFILGSKYNQQLIKALWKQELTEVNKVSNLPVFIKTFLDLISPKNNFSMTDSGQVFENGLMAPLEVTGNVQLFNKTLNNIVTYPTLGRKSVPNKQLVYFGYSSNMALLSYYSGRKEYAVILKFKGNQIEDFWYDDWAVYDYDVNTKNDILNCLQNMKTTKRQKFDGC
jgi:hypothetical protein